MNLASRFPSPALISLVGAAGQDEGLVAGNTMDRAGAAYVFERNNSGVWLQVQKLLPTDRAASDDFGVSVSISGNQALIGAPYEDENVGGGNTRINAGSAYIFERDANGTWAQMQKIVAGDREKNDSFGLHVALSGHDAFVGALLEDHNVAGGNKKRSAGSAYIFKQPEAGNLLRLSQNAPVANQALLPTVLNIHPNPFSAETNIVFQTGVTTKAKVRVFGLDGREIATLLNEEVQSGQSYHLTFDGSHLPAGVYILHLATENGEVQRQQLVISR